MMTLYSTSQRYNFESNLQQSILSKLTPASCIRQVKDTILKAIYNMSFDIGGDKGAVFDKSKIQF